MSCATCGSRKAALHCGACQSSLCKACAVFLPDDAFAYWRGPRSAPLDQSTFCQTCYEQNVAPALAEYEDILERAKDVNVFYKSQTKESRFIKRVEKPFRVDDCADKDDTVMCLAFLAAKAGFNAIIDVDVSSEKVRMGGWQTSKWKGTAIPARVDPDRLARRFIGSPN